MLLVMFGLVLRVVVLEVGGVVLVGVGAVPRCPPAVIGDKPRGLGCCVIFGFVLVGVCFGRCWCCCGRGDGLPFFPLAFLKGFCLGEI